ncbi:MAG: NAD(P)H-dependent oxidoreductase subunit E [Acidobacteria bacterium]|nr:MAG: NAD(P)H-dependent oxidoreductase subunit E [Acidobacteriota bacterium]
MSTQAFEFTPENLQEFRDILSRYPERRAALLPTLHLAQEQNGHISTEVEAYVAQIMELPIVDVREVVTFYSLYFRRPMGHHHIRVCMSIACMLGDCEGIRNHLRTRLGVAPGGVTADGKFSWEAIPDCLGACELAPMMQLDGEYYGNLTPEKVDEILDTADHADKRG